MIKQPDSDLAKKLKAIEAKGQDPAGDEAKVAHEYDVTLSNAWKQLTGEARDALDILLSSLEAQAVHTLQTPRLADSDRIFTCGQLNIVYQLQGNIDHFINLDPKPEDYEQRFGDPDATDGPGDKIIY
jgi:hypothetical protein